MCWFDTPPLQLSVNDSLTEHLPKNMENLKLSINQAMQNCDLFTNSRLHKNKPTCLQIQNA